MKERLVKTAGLSLVAAVALSGCARLQDRIDSGRHEQRDGSVGVQGSDELQDGGCIDEITVMAPGKPSKFYKAPKGGTAMFGNLLGPCVNAMDVKTGNSDALNPVKFGEPVVWLCVSSHFAGNESTTAELEFRRAKADGKASDNNTYSAPVSFDLAVKIKSGEYKWLVECESDAPKRGEIFPENAQNGHLPASELTPSGMSITSIPHENLITQSQPPRQDRADLRLAA